MPKDTFFNLSEEKRNRIIDAAVKEFKEYSFDASSINRIIENGEISKGSFYQYFEDKEDLYEHIIDIIVQKKLEYVSPVMADPFEHDIFTLLRETYKSGLCFAFENPDYLEIGIKLCADTSHPVYQKILKENMDKSNEFFQLLLKNARKRGEIREDLDLEMTAFLLTNIYISFADFYTRIANKKVFGKEMFDELEKLTDFVQFGISKKGGDMDD